MSWSFIKLFRSPDVFERKRENVLMLEQFLAELEARYVRIAARARPEDQPVLDEAGRVVNAYRAHRAARTGTRPPLPDWNEAFMAEDLLAGLTPPAEARADLAIRLAALKTADPAAWAELSAAWSKAKETGAEDAEAPAILVSALRATHWRNTQSWIIRTLGTIYAVRLRNAFLLALGLGAVLVLVDTLAGPNMTSAALSGLGFAVAAGLLGASFSAMVGQQRVFELDNIEEARAVTSKPMLALRLGVGVAAAMILYFFFEAGLVDGALFPDLAQIGFGRVAPLPADTDALRASAQSVERSADLVLATLDQTEQRIRELTEMLPRGDAIADKTAELHQIAASAAASPAADSGQTYVRNGLMEKLQVATAGIADVEAQLASLKNDWNAENPGLGRLAPNADLSKLVVWCFAAGFTQTLVPSLLARVTPRAESKPAAG